MVQINRLTTAQVRAAHAKAISKEPKRRQPVPQNARVVCSIGSDELLWFHGRYYLVPPVSADDGGLLLEFQARIAEMGDKPKPTRQDIAEFRAVIRSAVGLMGGLVRPLRYRARWGRGLMARLAWRLRRNPFSAATVQEVGFLLGFFSTRRTTPRVRSGESMAMAARRN